MDKITETDILIIGAGPVGLFTVFEAGLLGLRCHLIDNLDRVGGQCIELYPEKPIYDIPGVPNQTAAEHIAALQAQIAPFDYQVDLGDRIDSIEELPANANGVHSWRAVSAQGKVFHTPNLFIAAGAGSFEPRTPTGIAVPPALVGHGVDYAVRQRAQYRDKHLVIFGGGDSALDWTVNLAADAASLTLVHRRDAFRGAPATEAEMRRLVADGAVTLRTPYVVSGIESEQDRVSGVAVRHFDTNEEEVLACDQVLFLIGLHKKLGPLRNWGLHLHENRKILVDTDTFMTNRPGIFAVGDINHYPGKLDLILCGFHETTLACQQAYRRIHPGNRVPFGYTTSNRKLHAKLGVA